MKKENQTLIQLTSKQQSDEDSDLFSNAKLLIVDDDTIICRILTDFFSEIGLQCTSTTDSSHGAELIKEKDFDVLLSDIYMPGLSGHDLLQIALKHAPHTPVILMTGSPSLETTIEAIRLGAYDYMIKPFNMESAEFTLKRALKYRNLILQNLRYQQNLESEVQERTRELSSFLFDAVQSLSLALEARDPYTQGHGARVSNLVILLAQELGAPESDYEALRLASLLHDIGKIGVPDSILLKAETLTPDEYEIMKEHSYIGYRILSPIPSLKEVSRYVNEHHERMDGKGYPQGLRGEEIHPNSRILIVAEVCDALATARSYKNAWPKHEIVQYFEKNAGAAYDPAVCEALLKLLDKKGEEIILNLQNSHS